jgi:hypothetical protein
VLGRRWAYELRGVIATGSDAEVADAVTRLAARRMLMIDRARTWEFGWKFDGPPDRQVEFSR